jgi:nicotinamidase/pyrazinamidase
MTRLAPLCRLPQHTMLKPAGRMPRCILLAGTAGATMAITIGENDVLLVVDVQNDFCPNDNLPVPRGDEVVPIINRLADRFRHVVLTQDWHPPGHHSFASSHSGKAVRYRHRRLWAADLVARSLRSRHDRHPIPRRLANSARRARLRKGFRPTIDNDRETPPD